MFFNSLEYAVFLLIVLVGFLLTNKDKLLVYRNLLLLAASYYFYSQLNPLFVGLLVFTTVVNYIAGSAIQKKQRSGETGKTQVTIAIVLSLALLVFFKYAYVVDSSILLPVGLSFFTFQALTYSIDIYRKKIEAEDNIINVALFIAFFPTLLSGPIERARNLIPQLKGKTVVNLEGIESGVQLFIYGLFKKVVIADRLAEYVNWAYTMPDEKTGSTLAVAAIFYSFQIYCDFSGYADMAIASGRILGFKLMDNFNLPYCANTIKEFWRRWHISLTSWFTEYVYISLGGNRVSQMRWVFNISAVFLLSGIWHGATFSFVLWGALHAVYYLVEKYFGPKNPNWVYHLFIFFLTTLAWIFFRIEDVAVAASVVQHIACDLFSQVGQGPSAFSTLLTSCLLLLFIVREYLLYKQILLQKYRLEYVFLLLCVCLLGASSSGFVYFQF